MENKQRTSVGHSLSTLIGCQTEMGAPLGQEGEVREFLGSRSKQEVLESKNYKQVDVGTLFQNPQAAFAVLVCGPVND